MLPFNTFLLITVLAVVGNMVSCILPAFGVQGTTSEVTSSSVWTALPAVAAGQAVAVDYDTWFLNARPAAARLVLSDLQRALAP
ncbi:MAG TPA: hypothetical protein VIT41_12260 [Microlunatus sp.]